MAFYGYDLRFISHLIENQQNIFVGAISYTGIGHLIERHHANI